MKKWSWIKINAKTVKNAVCFNCKKDFRAIIKGSFVEKFCKGCKQSELARHYRSVASKNRAEKRWLGHIKIQKTNNQKKRDGNSHPFVFVTYSKKYHSIELKVKKRFTNMRYKVRKRQANGSHSFEEWMLLKQWYRNMCACCKQFEPEIKLTEDHIIPLSMGGTDDITNIQPLCVICNTRKHAKAMTFLPLGLDGNILPKSWEGRRVN